MQPIRNQLEKLKHDAMAGNRTKPPSNGASSRKPSSAVKLAHDLWHGFDAHCPALVTAKKRVADWYNDGLDRGQALVLAGPPGTGKSHLAGVVLAAYGAPHQAWMVGEADLIASIRATYDGEGTEKMIMAQYRRAPLLILDDVGTAHVRPESQSWIEDVYWRIFDRRAEFKLGTMLTTNLRLDELTGRLGDRAFSRLSGMMAGPENYVDLFEVEDYRMRGWK